MVRRVARDLIANDESEISEVVRRRLFEDLGSRRVRRNVARTYADWCFERSARLPAEWLAVDTATTESRAREFLRSRFEACYPFHPATLSVFQRKWRALAQFQQTRGALAMLAQWISWAAREQFRKARTEPLITLGSAPLEVPEFRAVVLGQLGESRLDTAIAADLAGATAHANALDVDANGALRDIHRRVGTAILFESSGGQVDRVAHLPELRFALGEPEVETTTIDSAATALEGAGFFLRKVGTDGYRIHHQATLKKVVSDRRASLDEDTEIKPALRKLVDTGALTRLVDPDTVLRNQIVGFVSHGDFGFASGRTGDGRFQRLWYAEPLRPDEVSFDTGLFLLTKARAEALKARPAETIPSHPGPAPGAVPSQNRSRSRNRVLSRRSTRRKRSCNSPAPYPLRCGIE